MAKTISICIPCYNSEKYIRTTIESALGQSVAADEIVISDDRSPDRSFEIVKEYEGVARVRILRPPHRTTLGGHYRFLLEQATSDYICFLSSDDALRPNLVETMHRELAGEENVGLIAGACIETDSRLKPLKLRGTGTPKHAFDPPEGFQYMTGGCIYTISFSLLSRRILLGYPAIPVAGDLCTDWCWAMMLGARGKMKFVQEPMGYYRIHASNAGHNRDKEWQESVVVMLEFLRECMGPELGNQLLPWLKTTYGQIENRRLGLSEPVVQIGAKDRLKNLAKRALTVGYRRMPEHIRKAELGIGVALAGMRAKR